ncbi:MAG: glutamate-5-semialdehyde dehydrogenase [Gammaproteobacteria bacterium]|nr:glutamate-5-semialdehyde dehydrogenase [Gammaproteobacteria bacterium]MBU1554640.1 glutamate-5-semialdehyde dehydrogenase [Gammaproteobacteria bacterium]MBU2072278.1 glutamate-5-semialdehyde dehydrogenase [Gammaproteobacteria bacterium]MBU2184934.1 glutamate-5-semialdehyde dehydrogenase [Gammaproteobacteria bacterium]MBU2204644.1 glutamate-5-semialdehyde dehydrogenase [Gammaproteobacteria bacterium]
MISEAAAQIAAKASRAAKAVANLTTEQKNFVLQSMANNIRSASDAILQANKDEVASAAANGTTDAMLDRLTLTPARIESMASAIEQIIALPDPVGATRHIEQRPNGINIEKRRIALGVICMIYEARPNVTADAGALCFKAGNAVILRCGREAIQTSLAIAVAMQQALREHNLPDEVISIVPDPDRELMLALLKQDQYIDLVIPRGGEGLIRFVTEHSRIPVIQHYKGVCHLYVDQSADLNMALGLLLNGKVQRPGVCNALEALLVNKHVAADFLPLVARALSEHAVIVHACKDSIGYFNQAQPIADDDFGQEYLAAEIAVRIVDDVDAAMAHIDQFGSQHTEVICTTDQANAERFIRQVDSAVVMHNASSRFSDGGELGLGAEIGISTSKLHAYGPMGLEALTTEKYVVTGSGQTRS